jgi:voltage-gated potassium channel
VRSQQTIKRRDDFVQQSVSTASATASGGRRWALAAEQLPSGRVEHRFESVVLAAALALIPVLIIENFAKGQTWQDFAWAANWVIWAVFAAELVFILTVAPRKAAALRAHWIDVALVIVTAPPFGKFLSSLRLVRLARLLRLFRIGMLAARAVQAERRLTSGTVLRSVGLITVLVIVVGGAAESFVDAEDFPTIWDGIWWSVVTVTTVGYGDVYPRSVDGRIIAMLVMFVGIGFLSVLTATIASSFIQTDTHSDELKESLARIEAELADVKRQLAERPAPAAP